MKKMPKLTQPIKWHGGKNAFNGKLAKWIISLMPQHTHYVEPYFGGGAVLLHKDPEGVSEVVNDIHVALTNFWQVIGDEALLEEFRKCVERTPFSEEVFKFAKPAESALYVDTDSKVFMAACFFVTSRQSRQGLMKDFATLSRTRTRRGMNEQVSSWLTAIEGLPDVHARLKRVVILNRDALKVIKEQDGPETCFYLDPPYLHETRETRKDYQHEMTADDHVRLLDLLDGLSGKFLLSGYRSDLYDYWAESRGYVRHEYEIVNNASSKEKKDVKTECVWTNFEAKPE